MSDSLDDFSADSTGSLDDFSLPQASKPVVSNKASNINAAAQASILSDDANLADNYSVVSADLDAGVESQAAENIVKGVRQRSMEEGKKALGELINSGADDASVMASTGVLDPDNEQYSAPNMIASETLIEDEQGAQPERNTTRLFLADTMFESQQRKKAKQQLLNAAVVGSDTDTSTALGDFVQAVTPFVETTMAAKIKEGFQGDAGIESMFLLGSTKSSIIEGIKSAPKDQQLAIVENLIKVVNANSSLVMQDSNDFARVNFLRTFLEDGYYGSGDEFIDNFTSVLDMTIIGGPLARGVGYLRKGFKAMTSGTSNVLREAVRSSVQPNSISQIVKDTNATKAKLAHVTAAMDETGEAAQALYGTSRTEAVANDLLPEVGKVDGSVNNKVGKPDLDIVDIEANNGAIHFTEAEKQVMRVQATNNITQVKGMTNRKEMTSIENVPDGLNIRAIYGPEQGGFSSAQDALDMAEWALRDANVNSKDIQLLVRNGDEYVPTTVGEWTAMAQLADKGAEGVHATPDFLVGVNTKYKFNPADVDKWSEFDVKYNIFDRVGSTQSGELVTEAASTLQRYALDPQSMLDPTMTLAANNAVDKASRMEEVVLGIGDRFGSSFNALPKERRGIVEDIIKEQNHRGKVLTKLEMKAQGVTKAEQEVLANWKNYWDNIYHLENRDLAKNLKAKGFMEFVDKGSDTKLFVKPVKNRFDATPSEVYNTKTGKLETLSSSQLDELYDRGGSLAVAKDNIVVEGGSSKFVVVENVQEGSYLRNLTDDSHVLNYREGYYTVNYTDSNFIVKNVKDANGKQLYTQAVATAGNTKDANLMVKRMMANDPGVEYFHRKDLKDQDISLDDKWDVNMNTGRGTQRTRGDRLGSNMESGGIDPSQTPILGPVDSMIHSARSVSQRVSMREMIETSKMRALSQYAQYMPSAQFGRKAWPSSIEDVKYRGTEQQNNKALADARTTWEYVNYLENGYVNTIDNSYKAIMRSLSDIGGGVGKVAGYLAESRGPTAMAKNVAFNAMIALSPLRQAVVQSHQAVQLFANFPKFMANPSNMGKTAVLATMRKGMKPSKGMLKWAGLTKVEADDMYAQFKHSGMSASIEKQNLVRNELSHIADERSNAGIPFVTAGVTKIRKVGFDAGEHLNMMTAWLAHRDEALRTGKNMKDASVADTVGAKARNYTYNMNAAGDMKYNQDALAGIFQFMQVPHKAMLQMTTNRVLTRGEKMRMAGFNAMMYTLPPAAILNMTMALNIELPEDPMLRDAVVQGLEGVILNTLLNETMGEGSTDFSGLSPVDMHGLYEFMHGLMTTDLGEIVASTPSGQMFFGNNPRLTNFAKTAARFTHLMDDYEDTPTTLAMVAGDFLKISSGMSSAFKAKWEMEYGKKINGLDLSVTDRESIMTLFGFPTTTETAARWTGDTTYNLSSDLKQDVKSWHREYKRQLFRDGITPEESDYVQRMFSEAWRVWDSVTDGQAREEIEKLLKRDVQQKDMRMYDHVIKASGHTTNAQFQLLIDGLPDNETRSKETLQSVLDQARKDKEL